MANRFNMILVACAGSGLALGSAALAQYDTGFETSDGITASPTGTPLTGQDGFYVPSGVDYWAMTYSGNVFGFAANPQGGDQFAAGQGLAGPNYSRAQRDITWPSPSATMQYDVACLYTGQPPASNNLGSFSIQPYPGSASAIHLFSYPDINNPTAWRATYLAYNADGSAMVAPGTLPGPEWGALAMNHWYRLKTKVDFATNQMVEASITDLTTNQTTTVALTGVYLEGGSAGGRPHPTGFRMFSGGGLAGNVVGFDNVDINAGGPPPYTCALTGVCPGQVNLAWRGADANRQQGILFASNTGSFVINSGPCAGTQLGLGTRNLQLYNVIGTGSGSGNVNANAGPGSCGGFVQLIQTHSCAVSNVAQVP